MTSQRPLCFVLMPFGTKNDASGMPIDFDSVYADLIRPAIETADLDPIRADEEMTGGLIHKPMFERLLLCEYAVADLTSANPNVFYELGVRHAARPRSTVLLFAEGGRLPFDVSPLRALSYRLDAEGRVAEPETQRAPLIERLRAARAPDRDSPVFDLLDWTPGTEVAHEKTDTFRERAEYSQRLKEELSRARRDGVHALSAIHARLRPIHDREAGVVVDLFLSYRTVKAWDEMIGLPDEMSAPLRDSVLVQEQLALALNRAGKRDEAERTLLSLIERRGSSSETYGILGRVYKDQWEEAREAGRGPHFVAGLLDKAIDAYRKGFEADWRDAYPGVNAVTLMEIRDPPDDHRKALTPIVRYAVERKVEQREPDYWDHATLLELAVLARDQPSALESLRRALAVRREIWEGETTARNLRLIREARERRGEGVPWAKELEEALEEVTEHG